MFEGVQDQFHQFLAAAAAASSTAPMRAGPPTHQHPIPNPLPLPSPLSFSLLHGFTSPPPPPQVYDSYPPHPQPSTQQQHQTLHHQWPPAVSHCNKHHLGLGGVVKQQGEGETTATGFLSTSLVLERDTSMAPSDFIDSAWSHEELLALLRLRTVENWFPEFTWEHVSRKLSEMGFKRSPQKCKEKFEEESRSYFQPTTTATANEVSCPTKINSYRLFSELEELCRHGHDPPSPPHHHHYHHHNHMLQQPPALIPDDDDEDGSHVNQINDPILDKQNPQREEKEPRVVHDGDDDQEEQMGSEEIRQEKKLLEETDGSEATRDDDQHIHQISLDDNKIDHDEVEGEQLRIAKSERKKRRSPNHHHHHQSVNSKKKFEIFKSFCEEIVNKMMSQQEELHNKILQDMTRRDEEMITREEAWKKQEMERINLEMEARAKDLALVGERQAKIIEFLKKFSSNSSTNNDNNNEDNNNNVNDDEAAKSAYQNPSSSGIHSSSNEESISQTSTPTSNTDKIQPNFHKPRPNKRPRVDHITQDNDTAGKRWPREEVLALINIRCNVDLNTNTGPDDCDQNRINSNNNSNSSNKNAPLWERISQKMVELGYNRSAKRCKEKWENINKYFRKTKDMNKNRSVDSRTCPYFHQLNHLYNQGRGGSGGEYASRNGGASGAGGGAAMAVDVSGKVAR